LGRLVTFGERPDPQFWPSLVWQLWSEHNPGGGRGGVAVDLQVGWSLRPGQRAQVVHCAAPSLRIIALMAGNGRSGDLSVSLIVPRIADTPA
jgi:hypothetical protein